MREPHHPSCEELELPAVLHALSDPVRLEIVRKLSDSGERCCGELEVPVSKSTLSHHLKVLRQAGVRSRWADLPPSTRVTGASSRAGRRLWFVSNWAWEPVTVPTPVTGTSLLSGRGVREGGSLELGAWDVDILAEA